MKQVFLKATLTELRDLNFSQGRHGRVPTYLRRYYEFTFELWNQDIRWQHLQSISRKHVSSIINSVRRPIVQRPFTRFHFRQSLEYQSYAFTVTKNGL